MIKDTIKRLGTLNYVLNKLIEILQLESSNFVKVLSL